MKKIPSLFVMTQDHKITTEVNPECQWVINGEGKATAKLDGTACMVRSGKLYKRYENSRYIGKDTKVQKTEPLDDWIHCGDMSEKGKFFYWIPVGEKDYHHLIGWAWAQGDLADGTYELIGPGINGNPHHVAHAALIRHGQFRVANSPRSFEALKEYLEFLEWEGIVWHHEDGRMCKLTKKKFGYPWGP